jgi:energy-converting hydrogenase Eha subunit A
MPLWGNRTFVFRDCPGEAFNNFQIDESQLSFLLQTQTAFCMISLPDLDPPNRESWSMEEILQTYINALGKNVNLRQQHRRFVVVLSKSDAIRGKMPRHLSEYLERDPVVELVQTGRRNDFSEEAMIRYLEELGRASDAIREWLEGFPQGKRFVNFAKEYNIDLRFSVISALGGPAESGKLQGPWTPYRVLDPIFWALELHSRTPTARSV